MDDLQTSGPECACLAALFTKTKAATEDLRLPILKQAVIDHGGRWDLPSDVPGVYDPALKTIQVFGVFAAAENLDELAANWIRAAGNVLGAMRDDS